MGEELILTIMAAINGDIGFKVYWWITYREFMIHPLCGDSDVIRVVTIGADHVLSFGVRLAFYADKTNFFIMMVYLHVTFLYIPFATFFASEFIICR
jgi:hypothetical protein